MYKFLEFVVYITFKATSFIEKNIFTKYTLTLGAKTWKSHFCLNLWGYKHNTNLNVGSITELKLQVTHLFFGRAHFENWMDSLGGWTTTRGKTPEQNVYALIKEVTYGQKLPNHWILFTKMCQNIVGLKSLCLKIHEPFSILSYLLKKFRKNLSLYYVELL